MLLAGAGAVLTLKLVPPQTNPLSQAETMPLPSQRAFPADAPALAFHQPVGDFLQVKPPAGRGPQDDGRPRVCVFRRPQGAPRLCACAFACAPARVRACTCAFACTCACVCVRTCARV